MSKRKYPTLRLVHEDEASEMANEVCLAKGLKKDTPKFKKEYEKLFKMYLDDAVGSLFPSGEIEGKEKSNPSTSKIPSYIWQIFDVSSPDSIFDPKYQKTKIGEIELPELKFDIWKIFDITGKSGMFSQMNPKTKLGKKFTQFKGAVGSLSNIFLELALGMRTKTPKGADLTKADQISSFQYRQIGENEEKDPDNLIQVEINRYYRILITVVIVANLERVFSKQGLQLVKFFESGELPPYEVLMKKSTRMDFAKNVYERIKRSGKLD
jgi:hypothetical protein